MGRKCISLLFGMCMLAPVFLPISTAAMETIRLTGGEKFISSAYGKWLERVYQEAFSRLNYKLIVVGYPSQRSIVMTDRGDVDGQIERGYDFNIEHPNLVRVEEPTNRDAYSAFSIKPGISAKKWRDLKTSKYSIVARRGVGQSVKTLSRIVDQSHLNYVETPEQAFAMLKAGHVDLYIEYEPVIKDILESSDCNHRVYKAGVLTYTTHHAFLHKKYSGLAPKLSTVLKNMKKEGLFERYRIQENLPKSKNDLTRLPISL